MISIFYKVHLGFKLCSKYCVGFSEGCLTIRGGGASCRCSGLYFPTALKVNQKHEVRLLFYLIQKDAIGFDYAYLPVPPSLTYCSPGKINYDSILLKIQFSSLWQNKQVG